MPTAAYLFHPSQKDEEKLHRWLADHPERVMFFRDVDARRPRLIEVLALLEAGSLDRVLVAKLADLGMTASRLAAFLDDCRSRAVTLVSVQECFDLMTDQGKKMAVFLLNVAQADREVRGQKQREGISQARAAGRSWGGRPVGTRIRVSEAVERRITDLFAAGKTVAEIAKDAGVPVSVRTIYRVVARRQGDREV